MKKLTTILTIIFAITVMGYGQDVTDKTDSIPDTTNTQKYVYCEIVGVQKFLSLKCTIVVDDGEHKPPYPKIMDENGKPKTFHSMIGALNYMGENGWEFVQAYAVSAGQQHVYHYLLKKRKHHEKADSINE